MLGLGKFMFKTYNPGDQTLARLHISIQPFKNLLRYFPSFQVSFIKCQMQF